MNMFTRNKPVSVGSVTPSKPTIRPAYGGADDPLSPKFSPSVGDDSKSLVNYLLALQVQRYGEQASQNLLSSYGGMNGLRRQVNSLMKRRKASPLTIKRATKLASLRCQYEFTFKYVGTLIDEVLQSCPET